MSISTQEIQRIAKLSCLKLDPANTEKTKDQISQILQLVNKMNAVETQNIQPMAHPMDLTQPLREDVVTTTNQREQLQSHVKYTQEGCYIVPQFIETE